MSRLSPQSLAYLSTSRGKGRCVRAWTHLSPGMLIEVAPVLVYPERYAQEKLWGDYGFIWGPKKSGLVLGLGSIFNHSFTPNARWEQDHKCSLMRFFARKKIRAGEEITINYNFDPDDDSPVWFKVK